MGVGRFIARVGIRLLATYIVALAVYFAVVRVLPVVIAGGDINRDPLIAAIRRTQDDPRFGGWIEYTKKVFRLDQPYHVQFLYYMRNMLLFEFGVSMYTLQPVVDEIVIRLPYTLSFYTISTLLTIAVGYYVGIFSAKHRGRAADSLIVGASVVSNTLPGWLILMLLYYFFAYMPKVMWGYYIFPLPVVPPSFKQIDAEALKYLAWYMSPMLIAAAIAWGTGWIYFVRQLVITEFGNDYVTTAMAKGLSASEVLRRHVMPNVRNPFILRLAYTIPGIFGGAIIFEQIANWPGVALFSFRAFQNWDFPVMAAFFTISTFLLLISLFIAEVVLALIDPRIRVS